MRLKNSILLCCLILNKYLNIELNKITLSKLSFSFLSQSKNSKVASEVIRNKHLLSDLSNAIVSSLALF